MTTTQTTDRMFGLSPDSPGEPYTIPCQPWCTIGDPGDEHCIGDEHRVVLSMHEREKVHGADGEHYWEDNYATAYAFHYRPTGESHVRLGYAEDAGMKLTPAEARRLAAELVAVADELEAGK